jgi:hypothetical protein
MAKDFQLEVFANLGQAVGAAPCRSLSRCYSREHVSGADFNGSVSCVIERLGERRHGFKRSIQRYLRVPIAHLGPSPGCYAALISSSLGRHSAKAPTLA